MSSDEVENLIIKRRKYIEEYINIILPKDIARLISNYDYYLAGMSYTLKGTLKGQFTYKYFGIYVISNEQIICQQTNGIYDVWNVKTGKYEYNFQSLSNVSIRCITMLPDERIICGFWNRMLKIFNLKTEKCDNTFNNTDYLASVNCITVLSDCVDNDTITFKIVTGSSDNKIRIFDPQTKKCINTLEGHDSEITCLSILSDGRIISGSHDTKIKIWNPLTGKCDYTFNGHDSNISCLVQIPDGRIVSTSLDKKIKIWDPQTNINYYHTILCNLKVSCLAVLADGRLVSGSDNVLKIWNKKLNHCELTLEGHTGELLHIVVLPDGRIVSGSRDKTLKIWS